VYLEPRERATAEYPGFGGSIEITKLSYTSGPYAGEDVELERDTLEALEDMIFDQRF